ncbi:MAG: hypothetical protein QXD95_08185 [Nitrososphaeria archaeon]
MNLSLLPIISVLRGSKTAMFFIRFGSKLAILPKWLIFKSLKIIVLTLAGSVNNIGRRYAVMMLGVKRIMKVKR